MRAYDGTVTIIQPLIAPLYGGKSAHEVLAALGDSGERAGYDIVRDVLERRSGHRRRPPPAAPPPRAAGRAPRPRRRPQAAPAAGAAGADRRRAAAPPPRRAFDRAWRRWLHDGVDAEHRVRAEAR